MFKGKKVIVYGERDGIQGPVISECLRAIGTEIIYEVTECFV